MYFRGEMCNGTSPAAFTLPAGFAPSEEQWLVVDECSATTGRAHILVDGSVSIDADPSKTFAASAQRFTSLDGEAFALS